MEIAWRRKWQVMDGLKVAWVEVQRIDMDQLNEEQKQWVRDEIVRKSKMDMQADDVWLFEVSGKGAEVPKNDKGEIWWWRCSGIKVKGVRKPTKAQELEDV